MYFQPTNAQPTHENTTNKHSLTLERTPCRDKQHKQTKNKQARYQTQFKASHTGASYQTFLLAASFFHLHALLFPQIKVSARRGRHKTKVQRHSMTFHCDQRLTCPPSQIHFLRDYSHLALNIPLQTFSRSHQSPERNRQGLHHRYALFWNDANALDDDEKC